MTWNDLLSGVDTAPVDPTGAYRVMRSVSTPASPLDGVLATAQDGELAHLVDAAALDGWPGWRVSGAQHVLVPDDVVRTGAGHAVALSWCATRLSGWLARRSARGPALSGGEVVTLAVSLLRGVQEAWDGLPGDAEAPKGTWWLSDQARPLFAHGDGGEPVERGAAAAIEAADAACADRVLRRVLAEALSALGRPRGLHRIAPDLEEKLFEAYAPRALEMGDDEEAAGSDVGSSRTADAPSREGAGPTWLERHVDADLGSFVGQTLSGAWETALRVLERVRTRRAGGRATRARAPQGGRERDGGDVPGRGGRRAPLLVGAVCAGAVLLGGALWPSSDDARADGSAERTPAAVDSEAGETARPRVDEAAEPGSLDEARDDEGASPGEPAASEERAPSGTPEPSGPPTEDESPEEATLRLIEGAGTPTLVDDYGDVAVTRADVDGAAHHIVLERRDGVWHVRQLYETAKGAG